MVLSRARERAIRLSQRRWTRVSGVIAVGLVGGTIGMLLGGRVETPVGPADVSMSVRPSWNGGTTLELPPLGSLRLDSHWGPVRVQAQVAEVHPEPARKLIEDPSGLDRLSETVGGQVRHGLIQLALRSMAFALVFGFLAGLLVFRSWRRALQATGTAGAGMTVVGLLAYFTFNPQSISEPRYTGLLANAPQVVGDAQSIVKRFDQYRAQLAKLVGNVSQLYTATSTLPVYEPDPTTVRVLHISDVHLNPVAWSVVRSVTQQFRINVIVDSGDLTDHGSKPEDKFIDEIETLKVPYVFVRGNHDSQDTQEAVDRQKNGIVLDDGKVVQVAGLNFYGVGDPRFTPDKTTRDDNVGAVQMHAEGARQAAVLRATGVVPDIAVIHDPDQGAAFAGTTPLVLSGHSHRRATRMLPAGTRLFIQGSTGGAGLRGLEGEEPTPIEMSVLYFNRDTRRLQGWDDFRLGGLGLTSAQIERHLEPDPDRTLGGPVPPTATPSGTPAPGFSPSATPTATPPRRD
ncbi:metallophosphoesterase family protein [Actinomadura craniellae]|uniref:metallophosphoesterase family protein n=1 Tax=Actinomadura craniellae TaxID=2231787 RepID=UPI001F40252C|nr:metallophosphoesterase [Actinomadura craniellae]